MIIKKSKIEVPIQETRALTLVCRTMNPIIRLTYHFSI